MTHIKIEIDSDKISPEGVHSPASSMSFFASSKPMVLVSTLHLSNDLKQSFEEGAGQKPLYKVGVDYDSLAQIMQQVDGTNRLIVTTGGLIAFNAARDYIKIAYFVSLVGATPTGNIGRCLGGIVVPGWSENSARVDFLVNNKGRARGAIGLFCNRKSAMNAAEVANWATIPGVNQTIIYAGNTAGHNNSSHYPQDFAQANAAGITTLVISADPFFYDTEEKLIAAANGWVGPADGTRYLCYPFEDYGNIGGHNQPTTGTASWYGCSLSDAYNQIGVTAALELNSTTSIGFTPIPDASGDF